MVIRTRQEPGLEVYGDGEHIIAMDQMQLELLAAFLGMVKLGHRPYQQAAMRLLDAIEEITDDVDFCSYALAEIEPVLEVHDPNTFDIIAQYDADHVIEIIV